MASKILNEIIKKNSPLLLYMYEHEYWVKTQQDEGWKFENKLNGSTIQVVPALDSSRGKRATVIILEEARLVKQSIIQSVFRPMAHPRQAKFLTNPIYANDKRWLEETKTFYISSASYKYEWLYRQWKKTFSSIFKKSNISYKVFAGDIYTSIENGLKTMGDLTKAQKESTEDAFRMEDLNEWIGNSEDAFFTYENFKKNQILNECFRPPTDYQIVMDEIPKYTAKKENEIRLIVADFAFTETKGKDESDFTQFLLLSGHWRRDRFEVHVDYLETWQANDDDGAVQRLKELYYDYEADYIVPDARNGGEGIIIQFSKPMENPSRGSSWNWHGFGMCEKEVYHVIAKDKVDYYRSRAVDKDCIPCLIPFMGTVQLNTAYWRITKKALESGLIKLLQTTQEKQNELEDSGEYFKMSSEQLADYLAPYLQVDMLVKEAVELKSIIKNDQIRLEAPRTGHRDRIVCLGMGMLVFDLITQEWNRQSHEDDFDIDDWQLVY